VGRPRHHPGSLARKTVVCNRPVRRLHGHIDGVVVRSCSLPGEASAVQADHAPCRPCYTACCTMCIRPDRKRRLKFGYCQTHDHCVAALLMTTETERTTDIDKAITNICRCRHPNQSVPRRHPRRRGERLSGESTHGTTPNMNRRPSLVSAGRSRAGSRSASPCCRLDPGLPPAESRPRKSTPGGDQSRRKIRGRAHRPLGDCQVTRPASPNCSP